MTDLPNLTLRMLFFSLAKITTQIFAKICCTCYNTHCSLIQKFLDMTQRKNVLYYAYISFTDDLRLQVADYAINSLAAAIPDIEFRAFN